MSFRGHRPLTTPFVLVGWVLLFSRGIRQLLTSFGSVRMVRGREEVGFRGMDLGLVRLRIEDVALFVDRWFS